MDSAVCQRNHFHGNHPWPVFATGLVHWAQHCPSDSDETIPQRQHSHGYRCWVPPPGEYHVASNEKVEGSQPNETESVLACSNSWGPLKFIKILQTTPFLQTGPRYLRVGVICCPETDLHTWRLWCLSHLQGHPTILGHTIRFKVIESLSPHMFLTSQIS